MHVLDRQADLPTGAAHVERDYADRYALCGADEFAQKAGENARARSHILSRLDRSRVGSVRCVRDLAWVRSKSRDAEDAK